MQTAKTLVPAIALAAFIGLPLAAQQPTPTPGEQQPGTPHPGTVPPSNQPAPPSAPSPHGTPQAGSPADSVPSTANSPEISNPDLRPVTGELVSKLDTQDAKSGDQVVLKTTANASFADGVVIPKGSRIIGHVTEVQPKDTANQNAKVMLQFDQAEIKGGQTMPIKALVQSVTPAGNGGSNTAGASAAPAPSVGSPSAPSGGSMAGSPGGTPSASAQSQGGAPAGNPGTAGTPGGMPSSGTIVARQGNVAIETTGIPGVLLATNAAGRPFSNASGGLLGARQNVHLDSGTQVTLAVMNGAPKVGNQ